QPVYGIGGESSLEERILEHLAGHRGEGPVRVGNQAYAQRQNDAYGELILAIGRLLLDVRFRTTEGVAGAGGLVAALLGQMEARLEEPDAGLWELRGQRRVHTFTLLTHWAGARRAEEIASWLGVHELAARARSVAERAAALLWTKCWDAERGCLTQGV